MQISTFYIQETKIQSFILSFFFNIACDAMQLTALAETPTAETVR